MHTNLPWPPSVHRDLDWPHPPLESLAQFNPVGCAASHVPVIGFSNCWTIDAGAEDPPDELPPLVVKVRVALHGPFDIAIEVDGVRSRVKKLHPVMLTLCTAAWAGEAKPSTLAPATAPAPNPAKIGTSFSRLISLALTKLVRTQRWPIRKDARDFFARMAVVSGLFDGDVA